MIFATTTTAKLPLRTYSFTSVYGSTTFHGTLVFKIVHIQRNTKSIGIQLRYHLCNITPVLLKHEIHPSHFHSMHSTISSNDRVKTTSNYYATCTTYIAPRIAHTVAAPYNKGFAFGICTYIHKCNECFVIKLCVD